MKSETAKKVLHQWRDKKTGNVGFGTAVNAVELAEQELCDKYEAEIDRLRTALDEANKRCEIAEKVIAQKNAEPRKAKEDCGGMSLNYYQGRAMSTCMPSCDNFTYMLTELNAEVGEINDKIAKWRRKGIASIKDNDLVFRTSELDEAREYQKELALELGDALWAIAGLSRYLRFSLEEIGQMNLDKLAKRKDSGTIVTHEDH